MKKTLISLLFTLLPLTTYAECSSLVHIIEETQRHNGVVAPVERETVVKLVQIRVLPRFALDKPDSFYVEIREKQPLIRLFNMNKGCAEHQWMIPRDFLILLGWKIA